MSGHSLAAALVAGGVVAGAALVLLTRYQRGVWRRARTAPPLDGDEGDDLDDGD